jgi:RNA polymerase sigma-70 factor (ECF subfamily)
MKTALSTSADIEAPRADDAELAKQAGAGDRVAFEALMRRHNRLLFRTARSILRNDDDTEDVLQEAYLRAWRALAAFRAESKVSTWLVRIVLNEALGRLRRRGAQVIPIDASGTADVENDATAMEDDPDREPERVAMRSELRALMEKRIDALPDVFRTVFVLRAVEEMSVEATACALDIPEATVRTRFFRARSLLREGLSRDVDFAIGDAFAFAGARCDRIVASVLDRISEGPDDARSCPPPPGEE